MYLWLLFRILDLCLDSFTLSFFCKSFIFKNVFLRGYVVVFDYCLFRTLNSFRIFLVVDSFSSILLTAVFSYHVGTDWVTMLAVTNKYNKQKWLCFCQHGKHWKQTWFILTCECSKLVQLSLISVLWVVQQLVQIWICGL